jgi:hypothetical protein
VRDPSDLRFAGEQRGQAADRCDDPGLSAAQRKSHFAFVGRTVGDHRKREFGHLFEQ